MSEIEKNEQPLEPVKRTSLWMELLAVIGVFVATSILASIIVAILIATKSVSEGFATFISYVFQFGVCIVFLLWLLRRRGESAGLKWSIKGFNPMLILYGVIMMLLAGVVVEPLMNILPKEMMDMLNKLMKGGGAWMMITTVVAAPILEEILFRGVIQGAAQERYGVVRSIFISAAIFGIIHLVPQQVIYAFFGGLILGYIYYRTHSLFSVILIHAINNAIAYTQVSLLNMEDKGLADIITNKSLYWVVYIICAILLFVSLWMLLRQITRVVDNKPVE